MNNRATNILRRALLSAGLAGVGVWLASIAAPAIWQRWEGASIRAIRHPRQRRDLVGRLAIPRLGVDTLVREGSDATTLSLAAGHVPGTAFPGQKGNVAVAGHRDTVFRRLSGIRVKDRIRFETMDGAFTYEVESISIVSPRHTEVLRAGIHPELTLITCFPFNFIGPAPKRFIVKARLSNGG